ncbi:Permease of the drug/metabolite transporter (DMT) superfamily [Frankineae bacterium MT45]|nr:Permease of the drug/metabolite transporter (DMT) superfamily [Frankineae bacterium MT45]
MSESPTAAAPIDQLATPPLRDGLLLVLAIAGVSFSGPLMAATAAPALAIAFWRNAMGAGLTLTVAGLRDRAAIRLVPRRAWLVSMVAGVALAAHFAAWVPSVTMTSVASATALVSTQVIFTALIAHLRGQRLPRLAWIGIGISTASTALITGADLNSTPRALLGDLLAILGGLAAALYVTFGSSARTSMTNSLYTAACYSTCSTVLLLVCLLGGVQLSGYSANAWVKIVLVTICAQILGHSMINLVLRSISPTVVGLAILFETPGAAIVAFIWLHQVPEPLAFVGVFGLLVGLVLVSRARSSSTPLTETELELVD